MTLKLIFTCGVGDIVIWHALEPFIRMESLNYREQLTLGLYKKK